MLATTGSVKVALESACIMLLRFRVRLLGLRVAWRDISIHTCCALSSSLSAHAAKSPARKRRRQARRGRRRPRSCKSHCMEHSAERAETCACMQHVHACARVHARGLNCKSMHAELSIIHVVMRSLRSHVHAWSQYGA